MMPICTQACSPVVSLSVQANGNIHQQSPACNKSLTTSAWPCDAAAIKRLHGCEPSNGAGQNTPVSALSITCATPEGLSRLSQAQAGSDDLSGSFDGATC